MKTRCMTTGVAFAAALTTAILAGCSLPPDGHAVDAPEHWRHTDHASHGVTATIDGVDGHQHVEGCPYEGEPVCPSEHLQEVVATATDIGSTISPMHMENMESLSVEVPPAALPAAPSFAIGESKITAHTERDDRVGAITDRRGDEIMVAGQLVHTGTPVVLWIDEGGYDAYRVERRFAPIDKAGWEDSHEAGLASPNRFGLRRNIDKETRERVRGGGWTVDDLRGAIDQIVVHYDASGTSQRAFKALHDGRGLSAHFLIDIDGTVYQTLDIKERAWHATVSNDRSVGIELANIGAYTKGKTKPLARWYGEDDLGTRITIPKRSGDGGVRTADFIGRPARGERIKGEINDRELAMFDYTPEQYNALTHLVASLCRVLPEIECAWPVETDGSPMVRTMTKDELKNYSGVLGHYHIQHNKVDPGPAFQADRVISRARSLIGHRAAAAPARAMRFEAPAIGDGRTVVLRHKPVQTKVLPLRRDFIETVPVDIQAGGDLAPFEAVEVSTATSGPMSPLPVLEGVHEAPIVAAPVVPVIAAEPPVHVATDRLRRPHRDCPCDDDRVLRALDRAMRHR